MIADLITAYEELDIVGDGQVDREELRSFAQSKGAEFAFSDAGLDQFFNQFDTDHDGKVSKKEAEARTRQLGCLIGKSHCFIFIVKFQGSNKQIVFLQQVERFFTSEWSSGYRQFIAIQ